MKAMSIPREALMYLFILALILVGAVYFVGVATDAQVFGGVFNNLLQTATGRNAQGNFASYPH